VGSEKLPSREVKLNILCLENHEVDNSRATDQPTPIQVLVDTDQIEYEGELLGELPEPQPQEQDIFTRHTWPDNPARVAKILSEVKLGDDITRDEKQQLKDFIRHHADIFALSLKDVAHYCCT
jgi:hypothetical protein